jgi:hypothetical protein
MKDTNRIIYSLNVEDVQNVAREILKRKLTDKEILLVEDSVGDYIDWFSAIEHAIQRHGIPQRKRK